MSVTVNLVMGSFEDKNRVLVLDYQLISTFKFIQCSKKDVRVR